MLLKVLGKGGCREVGRGGGAALRLDPARGRSGGIEGERGREDSSPPELS